SGRFRWWLVAASVVLAGRAQAAAVAPVTGGGVEKSVVKVFSTVRSPNYAQPWNKQASEDVSGSGVVIEGKRILTNAHVVLYASQVQVQAFQAGDKISATVEAIAPGIDLAVLKLDDDKLFATHPPLARAAGLPDVKDAVMAYGYPAGGRTSRSPRGSSRASSSRPTTCRCTGCASRSTPPSTRATAAGRRWW